MNIHPNRGALKKRAISGIIAALILFVMLFTVGTGYFLWINVNNSTYSQALAQKGSDLQNQQQENLVLSAYREGNGILYLTIRNAGGIASNVTELLITYPASLGDPPCATGDGVSPQTNFCGFGIGFDQNSSPLLPLVVSAQTNSSAIDTTVPVPAGTPTLETYTVKVVTANGNTFSTVYSPAVTSVVTHLLPSSIVTVGAPVNDSAVLVGVTSTAGGTVNYYYYNDSMCVSDQTLVSTENVVDGVAPNSLAHPFTTAGSYGWEAQYSGDASNPPATSPCEPLVVQATPTVTTSLSTQTVAVNSPVTDSATVSGLTPGATGSVSYYHSNVDSCPATGATFAGQSNVVGGVVGSSASTSFSTAGTEYWYAVYSGDTLDTGAVSHCEPLQVGSSPTITTTLPSTSIGLGATTTDSATLTGAVSDPGGGATVSFWWSFVNTCPTNGATEVSSQPVTSGENGAYSSTPSLPLNTPGIYYWYAVYSGDAYNAPATSACEPLTVGLAITTTLSAATITAGGSATDFATLHFATANAGGTVTYSYFDSSDCTGQPNTVNTVTVTNGGVPKSNAVTFSTAGSYSWDAVYSGDANNLGPVTSPCEPLAVLPPGGGTSGGSLGLVSESFRFYFTNCNSESNTGTCPPGGDGAGDGVNVGGYYGYGLSFNPLPACSGSFFGCGFFGGTTTANPDVFQIRVTNNDPTRAITLSSQSFLFIQGQCAVTFLCNFLSTPFAQSYWIVSPPTGSGGNGAVVSPYNNADPVTIAPGSTATLYFYCTGGPCTSAISPSAGSKENAPPAGESLVVSVGLFGIYSDGTPFAQTIPYVASYVSPVYITNVSPSQPAGALWITGGVGQTITLTAANFPTLPSTVSVYWTNADGTTSVVGTASGSSCTYVSSSTSYTCAVSFTVPSSAISGEFYGIYVTSDGVDNAYATVGVTGGSSTAVSCAPTSINVGGTITCTATVTGQSPTGTITWTQSVAGTVTFSSSTCTLAAGTCSVTAKGAAPGTTTVTGTYSGDINNQGSSGTSSPIQVVSLTINPTSGPVGTTTTLSGSGYGVSTAYSYCLSASSAAVSCVTGTSSAFTTTGTGTIPGGTTLTVPPGTSAGTYYVIVYQGASVVAYATFAVTSPTLTISPTTGPPGTPTTLSGTNYAPATIYDDCLSTISTGTSCVAGSTSSFTATGAGNIPGGSTVTVPSGTTVGAYYVIVYQGTSVVASASFTVTTSQISLNPASGHVGTTVTVTGTNFIPDATITIKFAGATQTTAPATVTTNAAGSFSATFTVPTATAGAQTVTASDGTNTPSATFTVTPAITLTPTSGPAGITVTVAGSGFAGTSVVSITFNGATVATTPTTVTTSIAGSFSATFTVPSVANGGYTVTATDASANTASATFTVGKHVALVQDVAGSTKTSASFTCSFSTQPATGDLILIAFTVTPSSATVSSVSDAHGHALSQVSSTTEVTSTTTIVAYMYDELVTSAGSSPITVTLRSTPTDAIVTCSEWSGVVSATAVSASSGAGTSATGTMNIASGSITPNSEDLVYAYTGYSNCGSTTTPTTHSPFTAGAASIGSGSPTLTSCGGGSDYRLNDGDQYDTSWGSGSTTAPFTVSQTTPTTGSSGWVELLADLDPPASSAQVNTTGVPQGIDGPTLPVLTFTCALSALAVSLSVVSSPAATSGEMIPRRVGGRLR